MTSDPFEKLPLKSKKFILTLIVIVMLFSSLLIAFFLGLTGATMTPVLICIVAGLVFIGAGYIGGVTWLDRWIRVAKINHSVGKELSLNDETDN